MAGSCGRSSVRASAGGAGYYRRMSIDRMADGLFPENMISARVVAQATGVSGAKDEGRCTLCGRGEGRLAMLAAADAVGFGRR